MTKSCAQCGAEFSRNAKESARQWASRRWCSRTCAGAARRRPPKPVRPVRPNYGKKRRITTDGYVMLWRPGHPMAMATGYVAEHRMVAYDAGLLTDPALQVHHRNGVKTDNRIENLEVVDIRSHALHHAAERHGDERGIRYQAAAPNRPWYGVVERGGKTHCTPGFARREDAVAAVQALRERLDRDDQGEVPQ